MKELLSFLNQSHSQYHAIENIKQLLLKDGFKELKENELFVINRGEKYFVIRNLTAIIAFKLPKLMNNYYYHMVAVHSDSPTFKVKDHVFDNTANCMRLTVEGYGGMIHSTWLDKPLSIAGRVVTKEGNNLVSTLVDVDKNLCIIPNVAIHLNRDINEGYKYNPQVDLSPIIAEANDENLFDNLLKDLVKGEPISYDLYLYNREQATLLGVNDDFISASKLDDLACDYTCLKGFLEAKNEDSIALFASFDNEEVGSETLNGADSTFLEDVLSRINDALGYKQEDYHQAIAKSFMVSADNGHAIHPNHPELSEKGSPVLLNKGIVIKHSANMRYTSEALSSSLIKELCQKEEIPYQEFFNRSDMRGGSTLGDISISHVSILSVDIGLPQLAMHSSYETMGRKDAEYMVRLINRYYSSSFQVDNDKIIF